MLRHQGISGRYYPTQSPGLWCAITNSVVLSLIHIFIHSWISLLVLWFICSLNQFVLPSVQSFTPFIRLFVVLFTYLHVLLFIRSFANPLIYPFDYCFISQLVLCFIASQVHLVCSLIRLFFFIHSSILPFLYPSINFSHALIGLL